MKRAFVAIFAAALFAAPAFAQTQSVGIMTGVTQSLENGFDTNFPANSFEILYSARTNFDVNVTIKGGRVHADGGDFIGLSDSPGSVQVEYIDLMTEYKFWETWGSSTIAVGPGAYKVRHAGLDDTQFGVTAAVGAQFPFSRRLAIVTEVGWHWVNTDPKFSFLNVNGGLRLSF